MKRSSMWLILVREYRYTVAGKNPEDHVKIDVIIKILIFNYRCPRQETGGFTVKYCLGSTEGDSTTHDCRCLFQGLPFASIWGSSNAFNLARGTSALFIFAACDAINILLIDINIITS